MTVAHHTSPPEGIEATGLVKDYPGDIRALDGVSLSRRARLDLRPARPQRRRQVDHRPDPVDALEAHRGHGHGRRATTSCATRTGPARHRRRRPALRGRSRPRPGRENLVLQGRMFGIEARELRSRIDGMFERFNLADAADRLAGTWSGGMRRKLDVAMGLINHPRVLFLDEPTTGLDPEARAELWSEVAALSRDERARDPADHPLPRGGRPPRRPPRDRRPRPRRRRAARPRR